ncbi:MAG: hypothetical protein HYS63_01340 [Methylocystis sp.]|nr:hypothetical protein [Methylocystis sp.]
MAKAREKEKASPLFGRRYEILGELAVLSPLHVGDGEGSKIAGVGGRAGANSELPEVARVVVDCDGRPYLPATTLKGLLRRIGETTAQADALDLFGDVKSKEGGVMGALLPRGARMIAPGATAGYPYVEATKKAGAALPEGVFVAARTAIDPFSGVAADGKLFFQQTVAPGARFELRLTLIAGEDARRAAKRLDEMIAILCVLGAPEGVVCGRGKADGAGRLRLDLTSLRIYEKTIGEDGALHSERVTPSPARASRTSTRTIVTACATSRIPCSKKDRAPARNGSPGTICAPAACVNPRRRKRIRRAGLATMC